MSLDVEVGGTKECEENGKDDDDLERNFVNWFGPRVPCVWSCFPLDPGEDEEPVAGNCGDTVIFYGSPGERATRRRS